MCLGIPGRIDSIEGEGLSRKGLVDFGGAVREVSLALVPDAVVGDYVIIHAGVAISVLDEAEAEKTLSLIGEIARAEETG